MRSNVFMKSFLWCFLSALCIAAFSDQGDDSPSTMGPGSLHLSTDPDFTSLFYNPALLGTNFQPKMGFFLLPISDYSAGVWNDKLDIPFLNSDWRKLVSENGDYISPILRLSFDLQNKDPYETSQILTQGLKDGVSLYMKAQVSLLNGYLHGVAVDVSTHLEQELHIPGAPFLILFSDNNGLQSGNTLDASDFKEDAMLSTNIRFAYGWALTPPSFLARLMHMRYAACGVGASYIIGHALVQASFDSAHALFNGTNNTFLINGSAKVLTAGTGLHGDFTTAGGVPVIAGNGGGIDAGYLLYDRHAFFGLSVNSVGAIVWHNVNEANLSIRQNDLTIDDLIEGNPDSLFDTAKGGYLSGKADSLKKRSNYVTYLPAAVAACYSYQWDFSRQIVTSWFLQYLSPSIAVRQYLVSGPCVSLTPTITAGAKMGILKGYLPIYGGIALGGVQAQASTLGIGFDFRKFSIYTVYKAVGSLYLNPKRGFEMAFCFKGDIGY